MAGKWDSNMKRLVSANPQAFIGWLLKGAIVLRDVSTELNRHIFIDLLYEVIFNGEKMLVHIEFQRYNDEDMSQRVREYNLYADGKHDCAVMSFVVYLKKDGKIAASPLIRYIPGTMIEIWRFNFTNVCLWEIPTDVLRNIGSVGVLPLLPLTREGAQREVVDEVLSGIEQAAIDHDARRNLLTITLTLARLALSGPEHLDWLQGRFYMYQDLIRDTEIYQLIMAEGKAEGKAEGITEGREEGMQEMILLVIQNRFPALLELAQACKPALADVAVSRQLMLDILNAQSQEDVRQHLERLRQA
jgi:predicted transposase YdaD